MAKATSGKDDKQKQDLKKLKDNLNKPLEEKRKPGRPAKERPEPSSLSLSPEPEILVIDFEPDFLISLFVKLPYNRLAKERGEHWLLTPDEEFKLKDFLTKIVAKYSKYIPQWLIRYNLEVTGLLFIADLINRRIQTDRKLKDEKDKKDKEPSNDKSQDTV